MLAGCRCRIFSSALIRKASPSSFRKLVCFCSSSSSSYAYSGDETPSPSCSSSNDGGSLIYRNKLQFQRPITIRWNENLVNRVSFIGSIKSPLKTVKSSSNFGVYTWLQVKSPPHSLTILLKMWDQMAEISSKHLKQDDLVYVSGCLGSYTKDANGQARRYYEVIVKELNFVTSIDRFQTSKKSVETEPLGATVPTSGAQLLQKETDRLYLWQVFFSNPHEWWDNRKEKTVPKDPDILLKKRRADFKHKDTGESLWLTPDDPPWVRRQLELLDSKMTEHRYHDFPTSGSRVSTWKYED